MIDKTDFRARLANYVEAEIVHDADVLLDDGLAMTSLNLTEFVMEIEDLTGVSVDIDRLESEVRTVGELYDYIAAASKA